MYAKIFRQMYDGTLAHNWQALVTFQQLLILSDRYGEVDMTLNAIQRITNIPMDILEAGIKQLEDPDNQSRTKTNEGRRIELLDSDRDWGWRIINHKYYRNLQSKEDKKEKDRTRIAEKRNKNKVVAKCRKVSQSVANVAYADTDADTDTDTKKKTKTSAVKKPPADPQVTDFIAYAYSTCKEKKGFNLHIDGGKDGITVKRLLATHDLETLKKLWDKLLASEDEFILKSGISIGVFKSQINKLTSGGKEISEYDARWNRITKSLQEG